MTIPLIDIHAHHPADNGTIAVQNVRIPETAPQSTDALFCAGIHPWDAERATEQWMRQLEAVATGESVIAIGETGLDFHHPSDRQRQIDCFSREIALAEKLGKPLIIHQVKAFEQAVGMLRHTSVPFILHGFTGSYQLADQWLGACESCHFSFGHALLRSDKTQQTLKYLWEMGHASRIFLETDDKPVPIREIFTFAAGIIQIPVEELAGQIHTNFNTLFPYIPIR